MECKKDKNLKACNCTYPCSRKGICCECLAYHRSRKAQAAGEDMAAGRGIEEEVGESAAHEADQAS